MKLILGNMLEYILELCYMIRIENRVEKWLELMVSKTKTMTCSLLFHRIPVTLAPKVHTRRLIVEGASKPYCLITE